MKAEIINYRYSWNLTTKIGFVQLELAQKGWSKTIRFENPIEFQVIISILNYKKPVFLIQDSNNYYSITSLADSFEKSSSQISDLF